MSVTEYIQEMEYKGLSKETRRNRRYVLEAFVREIGKPVDQVTREDALDWISSRIDTPMTEQVYRQWLNQFFIWRNLNIRLPYLRVKEQLIEANTLIKPDQVPVLLKAADHPRDRALLHVLYETGARAKELLGIRLKDIEFGQHLTRVRLDGKTGPRIVPIIESVANLQVWLNYCGDLQPGDGIWQGRYGPIKYNQLHKIVRRIGRKALGRDLNPHLFRHSRVTELRKSTYYTDAVLCRLFGWKHASSVVERYSHLTDKDIEEATLKHHGLRPTEEPVVSPSKPQTCPRCNYQNPAIARYCSQCSIILDPSLADQYVQDEAEIERFLRFLFDKKKDLVRKLAEEMRSELP